MITSEQLDSASQDALALTRFMNEPAGTAVFNSSGSDVGTLADIPKSAMGHVFQDTNDMVSSNENFSVDTLVKCIKESAVYRVVDSQTEAHIQTAVGVRLVHSLGPVLIATSGQSNAAGANADGPNPASPLVKIWDHVIGGWGSSDRTLNPLARSNPDGNQGNNNYALARAHRLADETGRPVFIVFDAQGGQPISEWVGTGESSPRFAALTAKINAALGTPVFTEATKNNVDEIIFAQGEADFNDDFDGYLQKLKSLRDQIRNQSWCLNETPIYLMSPSDLHDRYQWRDALSHLCSQIDNRCILVPANGLRTEYTETGSGDATHFYGESLWEAGYDRIADSSPAELSPTFFYGRATGPADPTDETAMATFRTLVSRDSWTTEVPPNGPAATGSISWGHQCAAEGNYSFALGYENTTDNLSNYGLLAGRSLSTSSSCDYFGGFGYQNSLTARYTFTSGRGNIVADEGATALGMFCEYTAGEVDPVVFQVGIGTSTSNRSNAITVRKSGSLEMKSLPVFEDNALAIAAGLAAGDVFRTSAGDLKIVI